MLIYSKMSLHAFGSGSKGYSTIWRINIINYRSHININILVLTPNTSLTINAINIGTSQVGIAGIVFLTINNKISIDPLNGAKLNEPSWALIQIPPNLTQTMHLWKFKKSML